MYCISQIEFAGRSIHCLYDRYLQNHSICQAIWSKRQDYFYYKLDMSPLLFCKPHRTRSLMCHMINWLGQYCQAWNMLFPKPEESSQQLCIFLGYGSSKMQHIFILKGMLCHEVVEYLFCKFFTLETLTGTGIPIHETPLGQ